MVTSAVSGKAGTVTIGAGAETEIVEWRIDHNAEAVDATSMSSAGTREFVVGLTSWSGSYRTLDFANIAGTSAAATFTVGTAAGTATPTFAGTIIITNEPVACPVDGVVQYEYTFQGTGALSAATT